MIVILCKAQYLLAVVCFKVIRNLIRKGLPQPSIIQVLPDHLTDQDNSVVEEEGGEGEGEGEGEGGEGGGGGGGGGGVKERRWNGDNMYSFITCSC